MKWIVTAKQRKKNNWKKNGVKIKFKSKSNNIVKEKSFRNKTEIQGKFMWK